MSAKKHNLFHYLITIFDLLLKSLLASLFWVIVVIVGTMIFRAKRTPYDLIFGLPMLLGGGGMLLNDLWSIILVIFSPAYNKGICPFCKVV